MVYDSLTSDTESLTKVKLQQVDRLTSLEAMVQAALFKQQDDIKSLVAEVNTLRGLIEEKEAAKKFDMDAVPAQYGGAGAPPVG